MTDNDCEVCGEPMQWIDCPTGGWWSHLDHPADDHDGEAPVPDRIAEYVAGRYVTKPAEVEAILWRAGENDNAVKAFSFSPTADHFWRKTGLGEAEVFDFLHDTWIIHRDGQWLIRGTKQELYPCDDEVFRQKYRPAALNDGGGR